MSDCPRLHVASEGRAFLETAVLDGGSAATALARSTTGLPVIANGGMRDPHQAELVLAGGHWALETHLGEIVALSRDFLGRAHPA